MIKLCKMGNWNNRDKRKLQWECNPLRKQGNQREQCHRLLFLHSIVDYDSSFFLTNHRYSKKLQDSLKRVCDLFAASATGVLTYLTPKDGGSELLRPNRSTTSLRPTTNLWHSPNPCNRFVTLRSF